MLFLSSEKGQGQLEYALILVLVAFVVLVLLAVVGQQIVTTYEWITEQISFVS